MDRFEALPTPQKLLIGFLLLAAVAGLFYFMLVDDMKANIASSQSKVRQLEQKKQSLKQYESGDRLRALEAEEKDLREQLEENKRLLPEGEKLPALITSIKRQADERGLKIRRFEKGRRFADDYVALIPVKMEVEGSFPTVVSFFEALAQPGMRMMTVSELHLVGVDTGALLTGKGGAPAIGRAVPPNVKGDSGDGPGGGQTPAELQLKRIEDYEKALEKMRVTARFNVNAYSYTGELLTDDERARRSQMKRRRRR